MKKKVWDITVKDNPNRVVMGENDEFYTTDTEAYLVFNLQDKDFQPQSAMLTLENRNDGSLKSEEVSVVGDNITWEMPERYIEHSGNWQAQLVYEQMKGDVPEKYTSGVMAFTVNSHIKDKKKPSLVEIENWEKFIADGTELIETWEDMEDLRQANEAQRQANYQELLDTGVLQTNINTKLEQLEEEYAPKLTEVTAQLAQTENRFDLKGWELNSKDREKRGTTVFASDDGRLEEYTVARDLFSSENVPQTIGVVHGWVGRGGFCTQEQLLELQNNYGWEIASHSKSHPNNPIMKDNPDSSFVEREFSQSKKLLQEMGFNVNNYIYPGGSYGKRERMFAKKHYRSARNSDMAPRDGVNIPPLNTHELKTIWLDPSAQPLRGYLENNSKGEAITMVKDRIKLAIDDAHSRNGLIIISTHFRSINDTDYINMYREIIQYAKSKTLVTTLNNALNRMGNIVEVGDYSELENKAPSNPHFIIGVDGSTTGLGANERNKQLPSTPFNRLTYGMTSTPVFASHASDTPNEEAGILINNKSVDDGGNRAFNYQEYIPLNHNYARFRRHLNKDLTYGDWMGDGGILYPNFNTFDHQTTYEEFPVGITFSNIGSTNQNISSVPLKEPGRLTTYKLEPTGVAAGRNYQEYKVFASTIRLWRSVKLNGTFGDWHLLSPLMAEDNSFDHSTDFVDFPIGITYSTVSGNNPNISTAPDGKVGTLITEKIQSLGNGYNFQRYRFHQGNGEVTRRSLDHHTWDVWRKYDGTILE